MGDENNDDPGSVFGDDLQYDFITPNFESKNKTNPLFTIGEDAQPFTRQVIIKCIWYYVPYFTQFKLYFESLKNNWYKINYIDVTCR